MFLCIFSVPEGVCVRRSSLCRWTCGHAVCWVLQCIFVNLPAFLFVSAWKWTHVTCKSCKGVCVCVCVCVCVRVRARPAAASVTLVNIKAALRPAELTNLSHPSPRAAFETHTDGLGSALWTLNHSLPRPPASLASVSNYTPVKYPLISALVVSPRLTSFSFYIPEWHFFAERRCDHTCCLRSRQKSVSTLSYRLFVNDSWRPLL